jgi:hypothetical protein
MTSELTKRNKKFWEELIAYRGPHRKLRLQQFFVATGTSLPSFYLATVGGYTDRPTDSPLIRHRPHRKWRGQQFICCCVYSLPLERVWWAVAQQRKEGYTLPSLSLATIGGMHIQTHRLMGGIYEVRRWGGLRCHDIYIPSLKIGSGIQKLIGGGYTDTQHDNLISKPTFFFKIRKVG